MHRKSSKDFDEVEVDTLMGYNVFIPDKKMPKKYNPSRCTKLITCQCTARKICATVAFGQIVTFSLALSGLILSMVATYPIFTSHSDVGTACEHWNSSDISITPVAQIAGMTGPLAPDAKTVMPNVRSLTPTIVDGVKVFQLIAQPVEFEIMNVKDHERFKDVVFPDYRTTDVPTFPRQNQSVRAWGYNGASPGPLIEVHQHDVVRIVLHNELPESTSIHFHGVTVEWVNDGSGNLSEKPTPPGGQREYQFTVQDCGTYFYHSGYQVYKQDNRGLFGMFVIQCQEPDEPQVDRDYALMLSSWRLEGEGPCPVWLTHDTNWMVLNGKTAPSMPLLVAKGDEWVRLRFSNPSSRMPHPMHLHGHNWYELANDGLRIPAAQRLRGSTVDIGAGRTHDVLFKARVGVWRFHCHILLHTVNQHDYFNAHPTLYAIEGGMFTLLCVEGKLPDGRDIVCPQQ